MQRQSPVVRTLSQSPVVRTLSQALLQVRLLWAMLPTARGPILKGRGPCLSKED